MFRTGRTVKRTHILTWKYYDNNPDDTRHFYAEPGAAVEWDGRKTEGPSGYGPNTLLWVNVWSDELNGWFSKGLTEEEVEWDES